MSGFEHLWRCKGDTRLVGISRLAIEGLGDVNGHLASSGQGSEKPGGGLHPFREKLRSPGPPRCAPGGAHPGQADGDLQQAEVVQRGMGTWELITRSFI